MKETGNPLLLPQDRLQEEWLSSARKSMNNGDFGQAVVLIRRILEAGEDAFSLVPGRDTIVSNREQATQMLSRLPEEGRLRFQTELDRTAREAWTAAKQDDSPDAIALFANRHRASQLGLDALRLAAANDRDRAHPAQAVIAWQAVLRHPLLAGSQRTSATVALFDSLLAAGQLPAAEQMSQELSSQISTASVAGKTINVRDWMQRRIDEARSTSLTNVAIDSPGAQLPALRPIWTRELPAVAELQRSLSYVQRYYRDQGVVSSPMLRPLIVGNLIVTRTMQDLVASDLQTGHPVWTVPNLEYAWLSKPPGVLESGPFRTAKAAAWQKRVEADSVFAAIGTNGKLVVVVQEPDRSFNDLSTGQQRAGTAQPRGATGSATANNRWNKLCAYDLANRQLVWQIGGPPTGPADLYGGLTFLGVPTFVDQLMYSVARRDDELVLLAMDQSTGHLRWSVGLGVLAPHIADNYARHRIACPVTVSDGLLLCPTAAGLLVAVSPVTRSIEWAFRYPLLQHDVPMRPVTGMPPVVTLPDVWWNEWREVACHVIRSPGRASNLLLMTSPDTDQLHAIDGITGAELWHAPRQSALHLAGVTETVAIVVEPMGVRAHDLQTGQVTWRVGTGEISGRGVISNNQYLQPKRDGGTAVIELRSGVQSHVLASADTVYDALAVCDGGWIAHSDQKLYRLPALDTLRRQLQDRVDREHDDAAAVELARLDLQASDPIAARKRLVGVELTDSKVIRQEALLMLLRNKPLREGVPEADRLAFNRSTLGQELLDLGQSDDERLIALKAIADAASADGDIVEAFSLYLDGISTAETMGTRLLPYWSADRSSSRQVRSDRILLSAIQRLLDEASLDGKIEGLETILNDRLDAARRGDPFAAQKLLDRLIPLEWARRAILANETDALYARTLQKAEPVILAAAGSSNRETSIQGFERFANLQASSGWRVDAEFVQRRMLTRWPGESLAKGETLAVRLATQPDLAELRARLLRPQTDPWPTRILKIEQESVPHPDVHFVPVRIQSWDTSLLGNLDVAVRRDGREVQFACAGYNGTWTKLLPGPPKVLRSGFANFDQVEAHAIGHQLILRVGSEVFGVLPFNIRGEPRAELTDLRLELAPDFAELPSESWWYPEVVPAKVGLRHEGSRLIDSFGRTFGGLCAVRANYLCYRSQSKLVVADLQTGRRLWERFDLPSNCQILGDDDYVYLWRTDEQTMQLLSVIDGHEVREFPWAVATDDCLMQQGGRVWSIDRSGSTTVVLRNARDASTVWSRDFAKDAIPFVMDQTTLGVVDPVGVLHILSADTGMPLGEPLTVDCPDQIERIVSLQDGHRWYVAISAPVTRLSNLQSEQLWGGSRVTFVNGWLYGIERNTTGIAWRRHLNSDCLPRHVSQFAPVIVQMCRRPASDNADTNIVGLLRVLDKRTGNEILTRQEVSLNPYSTLIPSDDFETLAIHTERLTIRMSYDTSTSTSDPAPERAKDKD